ncbi:hypothetical protein C8F04DRAFT_1238986 [Mycena alexandri]|uniref:Glucose-methanol-choline oxidoreductase N-terminal domain-containing protein n=1 Tax=Mycena alexandri TaxID=1745969 RepID=A0AAD6SDQ7_9AGAR|nr:hypothetical protein C8F04DRAFT_1238986 [Mycena alexandri]
MVLRSGVHGFLTLTSLVLRAASLPTCPDTSKSDFDFVVVGSGVGGGPLAARLAQNPQLELNYTYNEYSPGAKFPRNDSWYPRARGLGGSTLHNAMLNNIGATKGDFDGLATMFNDPSWSYDNMRDYFKRIEHNLDFNKSDPDHGFHGWLKTSVNPTSILANPIFADAQLVDIVNTLAASGPAIDDINSAANEAAIGVGIPSYTIDEHHNRSSIRDHLVRVEERYENLQFAFDTLATKILLCDSGGPPVAYGLEIAPGAALAVASNFNGKGQLQTEVITVRYEVIVSAGVFQSPQLLMLSGIGDPDQLSQHGIEPIVSLPGVGTNLQDHDEVANVWTLKQNYTVFDGCTVLYSPEDDPCLKFWIDSDHQNLYSLGASIFMMTSKSLPSLSEPDIMISWVPGFLRGFFRGFPQQLADIHNGFTAVILKGNTATRGVVRLTGSHPQDPLQIEKRHFEATGGWDDIVAIREAIKVVRGMVEHSNITMHIDGQVFPEPEVQTDEEIENHILEHVFGHHACCTNPIGTDDDPNAVLDGDFKVRGVENLRVVDISSWPKVPGWFVTTPTYMISEKAVDVIIAAAIRSREGSSLLVQVERWRPIAP